MLFGFTNFRNSTLSCTTTITANRHTIEHAVAKIGGNSPSVEMPRCRTHSIASRSSLCSGTEAAVKPNDASCAVV